MNTGNQTSKSHEIPLGEIEPHAAMLVTPPNDQLIYKIMKIEHLISSIKNSYLHFQQVNSYPDFPGADPHDSQQLPTDQPANQRMKFQNSPKYSLAEYYDQCRRRTYACCFGLENANYLWANYGNGSQYGKVGIVFNFSKLRARLNQALSSEHATLTIGDIPCHQIFSVNYGIIEYVDWDRHQANATYLQNQIKYTYLKGMQFSNEKELRVSLSACGMGHFTLNDDKLEFPSAISMQFDFRAALVDGTIKEFLFAPESNKGYLDKELEKLKILSVTDDNKPT